MSGSARPLDGITVLDVGSWVAGPAAATVMADFGAQVIKVEPPDGGDPYRHFHRLPGMPVSEHNYAWLLDSRNKKSLALDLRIPEGRDVLVALVPRADVFLTNLSPGGLERLRLRWEDLAPVNPRLVYASLTGYGEVGEEANAPGYDTTAWWARSGLMDLVRPVDGLPSPSMPGMGDHPTAMSVFGAIMLGLFHRERTGRGSKVSSSLLANGAWSNSILIQALLCGATFLERRPREQARNALANLYRARDGRWFLLTVLNEGPAWERFTRAIGRPDLAADARFATMPARHANASALVAILDEVFAERDWPAWRETLAAHDLPVGPVNRLADVGEDAQMLATRTFVPLSAPDLAGLRTVASPIQMDGDTKVEAGKAPALGEHTDEILRGIGYDEAAITRLRDLGAIA